MVDVFEHARGAIGPSLVRSFFDSAGSYERAGEFYLLSPIRPDGSVGSFHINLASGQWIDHATDESGDFIKLVSLARGIGLREAAEEIIRGSGGIVVTADEQRKREKPKETAPPPMIPIPEDQATLNSLTKRVRDRWCVENWGAATSVSRYRNESGQWVFCTVRFEKDKDGSGKKRVKNDILFYLSKDGKWTAKWHQDLRPFPLYGVEKLAGNDLPVLVVEGEKCARVEVPGFVVVSWLGGTANMAKSSWTPLKKRKVYIWPDADSARDRNGDMKSLHDQPGMKAAYFIKSQVPSAKILDIYRHRPLESEPGGWDIADAVNEGLDPVDFIREYMPEKVVDVEIDPWAVYRAFIEHFYDFDSLEQAGGGFWTYDSGRHFWDKTSRNDIMCNFQRWMEETGLQWTVKGRQKVTTFINEVKQYLERHSLGYSRRNPFRDAAVQPYIHLKNGAIEITKTKIKWHGRADHDENFFKGLFPVNCLDFNFNHEGFRDVDPARHCPAFYFFARDMVPKTYLAALPDDAAREQAIRETVNFLSQVLAYSLSPIKPNEYFFGIYGNQRTGKSFFVKILKSVIGSEFCIEKRVEDMDNRFASSGFWGKKVFIEPDLKTRQPLPEDFIKANAGEQTITIEEKHEPAQDGVKISMAMFFVSNYEFHTKGLEGLARRMILIPFRNRIENHDTRLLDKILGEAPHGHESPDHGGQVFDERPAILALAMKAWERFCENNYLMEVPEWAQQEKNIWLIEANSVAKFMEEMYFQAMIGNTTVSRSDLYEQYKTYCSDEGRKPLGKKNFFEEVRRDPRVTERKASGLNSFTIQEQQPTNEEEIPF
jgi:hypothetical protein